MISATSRENVSSMICDQVRFKPVCSATKARVLKLCIDSKYTHYTILAANNKGADQTAGMRRLICAFVVRIWDKTCFGMTWLIHVCCVLFQGQNRSEQISWVIMAALQNAYRWAYSSSENASCQNPFMSFADNKDADQFAQLTVSKISVSI